MKDHFRGYYQPTEEEFKRLWSQGSFVFDANILLNQYRYSAQTREIWLELLKKARARIFIPFQAAYEFQKNRLVVISEEAELYDVLLEQLKKKAEELIRPFKVSRRFGDSEGEQWERDLDTFVKKIEASLSHHKSEHPDLLATDSIRAELDALLEGNIGPSFDQARLNEIIKEGDQRFKNKVPPGFNDKHKSSEGRYGDIIVWKQLIEFAKANSRDVIFITDDAKDDWWYRLKGKTVGPHPSLVDEFFRETGKQIYFYSAERFLKRGRDEFKLDANLKAEFETKSVSVEQRRKEKYYDFSKTIAAAEIAHQAALEASKKYSEMPKVGIDTGLLKYLVDPKYGTKEPIPEYYLAGFNSQIWKQELLDAVKKNYEKILSATSIYSDKWEYSDEELSEDDEPNAGRSDSEPDRN